MLSKLKSLSAFLRGRLIPMRPALAIFIDGDGVAPKEVQKVLDHLAETGQVCVLRTYGNFTGRAAEGWAKVIRNRGLVARHMPSLIPGKNATEIALAIDAVEVLLTNKFDTFVLLVSDADFTPLACRIREAGKRVVVYGNKSTPESLRTASNDFHVIERLGQPTMPPAPPGPLWSLQPGDAAELVLSAIDALVKNGAPVSLGTLSTEISRRQPGFDTRTYSRRTLSDLVRDLPCVTLVVEARGRYVTRTLDWE